jgi:hypothetical protein
MIHPKEFPISRNSEEAEKKVFDRLKSLISKKYDVFYSKKFVATQKNEKPEYEIDFIIAKPCKAILVLEVKGGLMKYNGFEWFQNSRVMDKDPIKQVTSAAHSLRKRFTSLNMSIGWALCFPDCDKQSNQFPTEINEFNLIDQNYLFGIDKFIDDIFRNIETLYSKIGCSQEEYKAFIELLTRELDFSQPYNTQLLYDEELIQKMTDKQYKLYANIIKKNNKVLVSGVAGSGKTLLASKIALDFAEQGKNVLFLCYSKMLGNRLKQDLKGKECFTKHTTTNQLVVNYFEDFAKKTICNDTWWNTNYENRQKEQKVNEFYILDVPAKLEEIGNNLKNTIDILIIDEAQDFEEDFYFSVLFEYIKENGKILLFQDNMQDIFDRKMKLPTQNKQNFVDFPLEMNCRSSKEVVNLLNKLNKNTEITYNDNTPQGILQIKQVGNDVAMVECIENEIKRLVKEEKITDMSKILVISHLTKIKSCFKNTNKLANFTLVELNEQGVFEKNKIHYTTISKFKGLECDIVFVANAELGNFKYKEEAKDNTNKILYSLISRAKHSVYIYHKP